MSLDITVHHFNVVNSSLPSSTYLLDAARHLVNAATASSDWHSIIPMPSDANLLSAGTSKGSCFTWGRVPPIIGRGLSTAHGRLELCDWDAPLEDGMEIIDLDSLPEFEQMELRDIFLHPKSRFTGRTLNLPSRSRRHSAVGVDFSSDTPPSHHSSEIGSFSSPAAAISISKLIPFPHYHESLNPLRPPPPEINNIPAFHIARRLTSSLVLTTPFARTAWLVPLRGVPPVDGASSAQFDGTISREALPRDGTLPRNIYWTATAIRQFWTFLLRQRNMNNFGPISLAYMLSSPAIHKRQGKVRDQRGKEKGQGNQTNKQKNRALILDEDNDEPRGSVWEYIKIYHDSQYAMKLRSLLDSFRWEDDRTEDRGKLMPPTQYRVLKATRLLLVDETGEAVLLA